MRQVIVQACSLLWLFTICFTSPASVIPVSKQLYVTIDNDAPNYYRGARLVRPSIGSPHLIGGPGVIKISPYRIGPGKMQIGGLGGVINTVGLLGDYDFPKCPAIKAYITGNEFPSPDICKLCKLGLVRQYNNKKVFRQGETEGKCGENSNNGGTENSETNIRAGNSAGTAPEVVSEPNSSSAGTSGLDTPGQGVITDAETSGGVRSGNDETGDVVILANTGSSTTSNVIPAPAGMESVANSYTSHKTFGRSLNSRQGRYLSESTLSGGTTYGHSGLMESSGLGMSNTPMFSGGSLIGGNLGVVNLNGGKNFGGRPSIFGPGNMGAGAGIFGGSTVQGNTGFQLGSDFQGSTGFQGGTGFQSGTGFHGGSGFHAGTGFQGGAGIHGGSNVYGGGNLGGGGAHFTGGASIAGGTDQYGGAGIHGTATFNGGTGMYGRSRYDNADPYNNLDRFDNAESFDNFERFDNPDGFDNSDRYEIDDRYDNEDHDIARIGRILSLGNNIVLQGGVHKGGKNYGFDLSPKQVRPAVGSIANRGRGIVGSLIGRSRLADDDLNSSESSIANESGIDEIEGGGLRTGTVREEDEDSSERSYEHEPHLEDFDVLHDSEYTHPLPANAQSTYSVVHQPIYDFGLG